jgi:hypothetical protein
MTGCTCHARPAQQGGKPPNRIRHSGTGLDRWCFPHPRPTGLPRHEDGPLPPPRINLSNPPQSKPNGTGPAPALRRRTECPQGMPVGLSALVTVSSRKARRAYPGPNPAAATSHPGFGCLLRKFRDDRGREWETSAAIPTRHPRWPQAIRGPISERRCDVRHPVFPSARATAPDAPGCAVPGWAPRPLRGRG